MRSDCCDNCAKGLSTWKLSDLYVGIDEQGLYDFTRDADILINAIKCMEMCSVPPARQKIIDLLNGKRDKSLELLPHYGIGKERPHYYWSALMDQLMFDDYIDFGPGRNYLTLSKKGEHFRVQDIPKTMKSKPMGAIYKFIERKPSTPFSKVEPMPDEDEYS